MLTTSDMVIVCIYRICGLEIQSKHVSIHYWRGFSISNVYTVCYKHMEGFTAPPKNALIVRYACTLIFRNKWMEL